MRESTTKKRFFICILERFEGIFSTIFLTIDKLSKRECFMLESFFIYAIGISVGVFLLYFLGVALAPYAPSKIKNEHFECGLPASASTPKKANFGFFVYAIMFIVADMSVLFVALFVYTKERDSLVMASVFVLVLAVAISLSMRELQKEEK